MENWRPLYIFGLCEENIHSIVPDVPSISQSQKTVETEIEGKVVAYRSALIAHIPYFKHIGRNFKDSGRINWKEAPSFPLESGGHLVLNHEMLGLLIQKLSNPNYLWEEDLTLFDPLSVGISPSVPFSLVALKNILRIQAQLLNDPLVQWRQFSNLSPLEGVQNQGNLQKLFELENDSYKFSASSKLNYKPIKAMRKIFKLETPDNKVKTVIRKIRTFHSDFFRSPDIFSRTREEVSNKVLSGFVKFLDEIATEEIEKKGKVSFDRLKMIKKGFKKCPHFAERLTVLTLPLSVSLKESEVSSILEAFPNVRSIWMNIETEESNVKDFFTYFDPKHIQLRVHYEVGDIQGSIKRVVKALNCLLQVTSGLYRCYYCNTLIFDFLRFLDSQRVKELEETEKSHINQINILTDVLSQLPDLSEYLTVLELSSQTHFSIGSLPQLLQMLPRLLFLRIELGENERLRIEDPKLDDNTYAKQLISETNYYNDLMKERKFKGDISFTHLGLQLLQINWQTFSPGQRETLERFLPNAYLDIETTEFLEPHWN